MTQIHKTQKMLLENYTKAANEWRSVINRLDDLLGSPDTRDLLTKLQATQKTPEEIIEESLGKTHLSDDKVRRDPYCCDHAGSIAFKSATKLNRCAWCKSPSAALRRCSRCGKVQ